MYMQRVQGYKKTWNVKRFCVATSLFIVISTLLCVVFLHYQITTSHETDDRQSFQPIFYRRIRSVQPTEKLTDSRDFPTDTQRSAWLKHYCYGNPPTPAAIGAVPEGFILQQIHILLRPGITSSENIHNCVKVPASSHLLANHTHYLLKNSVLCKTFQNVPATNSSIHCRKEQLHPLAHLQFQELGKTYNRMYMKKWNIETSHVAPKHFRIHSMDKTDSLSSLLSFLDGMLPYKHFVNINVQKLDAVTISKTRGINSKLSECNFLSNLTDYLNEHFVKLSQKEGGMNHFASNTLPNICSSSFQNSTNSSAENIVKNALLLMDKGVKSCSNHQKCRELADLHTFPWLQEFVRNVRMINHVFEKVFVYAVDRAFISYLLSSLRHRNVKVTHPGSHVAIEVYKNLYETVNPYYVKILYNGVDISHHVPLCTRTYPWSLCKLKYFVDFQRQKYKSLFKASPMLQRNCHFSLL